MVAKLLHMAVDKLAPSSFRRRSRCSIFYKSVKSTVAVLILTVIVRLHCQQMFVTLYIIRHMVCGLKDSELTSTYSSKLCMVKHGGQTKGDIEE